MVKFSVVAAASLMFWIWPSSIVTVLGSWGTVWAGARVAASSTALEPAFDRANHKITTIAMAARMARPMIDITWRRVVPAARVAARTGYCGGAAGERGLTGGALLRSSTGGSITLTFLLLIGPFLSRLSGSIVFSRFPDLDSTSTRLVLPPCQSVSLEGSLAKKLARTTPCGSALAISQAYCFPDWVLARLIRTTVDTASPTA